MFTKDCIVCGSKMFRVKKSESERPNWKFCSRSCQTSFNNKNREKPTIGFKACILCGCSFSGSINNYKFIDKRFCSRLCAMRFINANLTEEQRLQKSRKISIANKGKSHTHSDEARRKASERLRGDRSHFWKGGKTEENKLLRASVEYSIWRKSVFERDIYTCQVCGIHGGYLEADHIKSFAYYPELRFDTSNGRTICRPCHKLTDNYMGRAKRMV